VSRKALAIHEAGHAVIGRVLMLVCGPASIRRDDDRSGGSPEIAEPERCVYEWEKRGEVSSDLYHAALRARIIAVMAGGEAVAVLIDPDVPRGDNNDLRDIDDMIDGLDPPDPPRCEARLRAMTRMLIRRHKPLIERVATDLLALENLTETQLDMLVDGRTESRKRVITRE
jgi:hypothetical protein